MDSLTDRLKAALAWNEATVNDNADDGKWLGGSHGRAVNTAWKRGAGWEHVRTEELVKAMVKCVEALETANLVLREIARAHGHALKYGGSILERPIASLEAALEKMEGGG